MFYPDDDVTFASGGLDKFISVASSNTGGFVLMQPSLCPGSIVVHPGLVQTTVDGTTPDFLHIATVELQAPFGTIEWWETVAQPLLVDQKAAWGIDARWSTPIGAIAHTGMVNSVCMFHGSRPEGHLSGVGDANDRVRLGISHEDLFNELSSNRQLFDEIAVQDFDLRAIPARRRRLISQTCADACGDDLLGDSADDNYCYCLQLLRPGDVPYALYFQSEPPPDASALPLPSPPSPPPSDTPLPSPGETPDSGSEPAEPATLPPTNPGPTSKGNGTLTITVLFGVESTQYNATLLKAILIAEFSKFADAVNVTLDPLVLTGRRLHAAGTVRAAIVLTGADAAGATAYASSPAFLNAISAAGVTGVTLLSNPGSPTPSSSASMSGASSNDDLYALLVLLVIPVGGLGYFGYIKWKEYIVNRDASTATLTAEQGAASVDASPESDKQVDPALAA